jgi:hypothetical protein
MGLSGITDNFYRDTISQNVIRVVKASKGGMGGTYGIYEGKEQCVRLIFVQKCERNRTGAGVWSGYS